MSGEKKAQSLIVYLIPSSIRYLPHEIRKRLTHKFLCKCPVPEILPVPSYDGERMFKRLFAVISGGENGKVECVYYVEQNAKPRLDVS